MRFKREDKAKGLDSRCERLICTGMVVNDRVCHELSQVQEASELFATDFSGWVARTCLTYWKRHKAAPGRHIEDAFHLAKKESKITPDVAALVSEFLSGISAEYEAGDKFNAGYVVSEVALPYLRARALKMAIGNTSALLEAGRLDDAEVEVTKFRKLEKPGTTGVDPFNDRDLFKRALAQIEQPLFTVPGALGRLLAPQLVRTNFVSLIGVVGRGKSYMLAELAKYAARARCNILFIGIGDMSEEDYQLRWAINLAGKSNVARDCIAEWVPCADCVQNQNGSCRLPQRTCKLTVGIAEEVLAEDIPDITQAPTGYVPCSACMYSDPNFLGAPWMEWSPAVEPLTVSSGWKVLQRFNRRLRGRHFRMAVYPSKALTPNGLEALMERIRDTEGWVPDVVFGDYMDEFDSDAPAQEQYRHREADKWSRMRGIFMRWKCLGIFAEQSDAAGYDADTLGIKNFNEDRRRNDVVTGKLGYNRTDEDELRGTARLSWAGKIRNSSFTNRNQVVLVQNFKAGRPVVGSWWKKYS